MHMSGRNRKDRRHALAVTGPAHWACPGPWGRLKWQVAGQQPDTRERAMPDQPTMRTSRPAPAMVRGILLLVPLAGAWAACSRTALAEDWPTVMHDNQRTGVTGETVRPPLELLWTFRSPSPPAAGWAQPVNGYGARKSKPNVSHDDAFRVIAAGGSCYFSSSAENRIYAVDAATGTVRWTFFTAAAPRLAPAYWKGRLYVGSDDGVFYCLDARTGKVAWQVAAAPRRELMLGHGRLTSVWPIRSGGIVDGGTAYFTAGLFPHEGITFYAVQADNGAVVWRKRIDGTGHVPQGYILATADSLFTTSRTAPARWRKGDGAAVAFNTPFPDVPKAHEYRFYNGGTGAQIWKDRHIVYGRACVLACDPDMPLKDKYGRPRPGGLLLNWFNARRILFKGEMAYVATDYHILAVRQDRLAGLAADECKQFELAYKSHRIASYLDHLDEHRRVVAAHGKESPQAKRLTDGPLKWGKAKWDKFPAVANAIFARFARKCAWMTPLKANESFILAGDVLYAGADTGVFAFDAATGRKLWQFETAARVRGLAAANGKLYVSTVDGTVRCFARGRAAIKGKIIGATVSAKRADRLAAAATAKQVCRIIDTSSIRKGYCLLLGCDDGHLAGALARATDLHVEVLLDTDEQVAAARATLAASGLYGSRVTVRKGPLAKRRYPPYVFNLVVDLGTRAQAKVRHNEAFRVTRPCGGVLLWRGTLLVGMSCSGRPLTEVPIDGFAKVGTGPISGARDWRHNYATAGNTSCSEDQNVRGPFGVLWYGRPGPRQRIERHASPPMPLVVGGRLYTIGYDRVMAYDIYNGLLHWRREIRGVTRTGLPIDVSNMAADDKRLYLVVDGGTCLALDLATGKTTATYAVGKGAQWAWIARDGKLLFGSRRSSSPDRAVRKQCSEAVFAIDAETGRPVWTYRGDSIDHGGIALADGRVFLLDRRMTEADRRAALAATVRDTSVPDRKPVDRHGKTVGPDLRKLVALDSTTGKLLWTRSLNITDVTLDDMVVQGRGAAACMAAGGVVVVHGTGSLGHPHKEFLAGKFARRALYVFDARTGQFLWGGRKGYRKRPIIVGRYVYAEPFAWDLKTGKIRTAPNPLSGKQQTVDFHRGYIGCGHLMASGPALFGARGGIAHYNLDQADGFVPFAGMALACGLCAVPAGGVLAVPEGRSGCTCATAIYTSIALYPRSDRRGWGTGFAGGRAEVHSMPVKHVSINLGAPGYRSDSKGNLWIPYPTRMSGGLLGKWLPTYQHDQRMCYRLDDLRTEITGTDTPWLLTSGYAHAKALRFRLIGDGQPAATYTVRLYFAEPEDVAPGKRVFSVRLQGKTILKDLDIARQTGGPRRAFVKEIKNIRVKDYLDIQLTPAAGSTMKPILSAFRALRQKKN